MQCLRRVLVLGACGTFLLGLMAFAQDQNSQDQDSQSLGDAARQARQQKQQKDGPAEKDAQAPLGKKPVTPNDAAKAVPNKDAQSKDGQAKDAAASAPQPKPSRRVITNDEIPEHIGPTSTQPASSRPSNVNYPQPTTGNNSPAAAEQWKNQIVAAKSYVASLQSEISNLEQSVHYAGGNCVSGCAQWNERQKEKQDQVEVMKQQLEQQQKRLEEMQEMARRQGFGSSVYDP